jgi:hypothetical protein
MQNALIPLRDAASVSSSLPSGVPSVRLLWARTTVGGSLTIGGIQSGLTTIRLRVVSDAASVTVTVSPAFGATDFLGTIPALPGGSGPYLVEALSDTGTLLDSVAAALDDVAPKLDSGLTASAGPGPAAFLAGTPDRIIERRAFSLLAIEPLLSIDTLLSGNLSAVAGKKIERYDLKGLGKALVQGIDPLRKKLISGDLTAEAYRAARSELIAATIPSFTATVDGPKATPVIAKYRTLKAKGVEPRASASSKRIDMTRVDDGLYFDKDRIRIKDLIEELLETLTYQNDFGQRVGALFLDRLRYRPAGLFPGEPLYSLSLLPGEEVQLRQVVETKRKGVLEEVKDREDERTLSLNATWSTDVSEGLTQDENLQKSFSMSGNASVAPSPEVPIGAGITVGSDLSEAHAKSAEWTTQTNRQISSQATARQRAQHKIRMEITTEDSTSFGSTRTLRNANRQRSVTHVFHKMYRREHALLERHGVRLCLRLQVDDPSAAARGRFLAGIDKLDPNNPINYPSPLEQQLVAPVEIMLPPEQSYSVGGGGSLLANVVELPETVRWGETLSFKANSIKTKRPSGEKIPDGYVLRDVPVLELVSFVRFDTGDRHQPANLQLRTPADFYALGGSFAWDPQKTPKAGLSDSEGRVIASTITRMYAKGFDEFSWGIRDIKVRVTSTWVPSAALTSADQTQREMRRMDLVRALEEGAAQRLRDSLQGSFQGGVIAQAVERHLVPPVNFNLDFLRQVFDFEQAIVEVVPYWATETGRLNYRLAREKLEALPILLPVDELLPDEFTASQAVVYLPIREGAEQQALRFLPDIPADDSGWIQRQVDSFRSTHFAPLPRTASTYADVSSPRPPTATLSGATDWTSEWEKPVSKFMVLAEWAEHVPTDGLHCESRLSDSVVTDEHQTASLQRLS